MSKEENKNDRNNKDKFPSNNGETNKNGHSDHRSNGEKKYVSTANSPKRRVPGREIDERDDYNKNKKRRDSHSDSNSKSSYHHKRKHKRSSRSRSHKKRDDQHTRDKREKYKKRSRSRSRHRLRHKRHRSKSRSEKRHEGKRSSRHDSQPKQIAKRSEHSSSESTQKRKNFFEERRKVRNKSRSNSALRVMKMKNLENACGYYQRFYQRPHEDNDPGKPQLYWDGYQWVVRPTSISHTNFDVIKPGRKVQISNVPLHLNLQATHFKDFLVSSALERNVISTGDVKEINNIVRAIELNIENNTAVIVMESTDLTKRMVLLDGLMVLGHTLRFSPYKEITNETEISSNIAKNKALADSAYVSALSNAISYAAFKSLFNENENVQLNFNADDQKVVVPNSKVIKVMNLVDVKDAPKMTLDQYEEKLDDIKEEFEKFGNIVSCLIIKPKNEKLGAEATSVFVEFQDFRSAEMCMKAMKGRHYEGRQILMAYIDENVYKKEIL